MPKAAAPEEFEDTLVVKLIDRLKLAETPTVAWHVIMNSPAPGGGLQQVAAHELFCTFVINLSAIVGHTAGVERMGKLCPMIHSKLRASLHPTTVQTLMFIYANLALKEEDNAVSLDEFGLGLLDEYEIQRITSEMPSLSTIQRYRPRDPTPTDGAASDASSGSSPSDDSSDSSSPSSGGTDDEEEAEEEEGGEEEPKSIFNFTPSGFAPIISPLPTEPFTAALLGCCILAFVKLPRLPLGWHFGTLTRHFDPIKDKKYGALYNFDVTFAGCKGAVGMKLEIDGVTTAYISQELAADTADTTEGTWLLLQRDG